jgi:methyl-accepting chemotaxis protein
MFSRLSIRNKISIVIAFLLLAMTGMGVLAVTRMQEINAKAVDIQSNWLPSVRALGELRTGVMNYRSVLRGSGWRRRHSATTRPARSMRS